MSHPRLCLIDASFHERPVKLRLPFRFSARTQLMAAKQRVKGRRNFGTRPCYLEAALAISDETKDSTVASLLNRRSTMQGPICGRIGPAVRYPKVKFKNLGFARRETG